MPCAHQTVAMVVEPKNVLDKDMREAILKLERRGEKTRRRVGQDHGNEPWFREWDAMPESVQTAENADKEDASSRTEAGVLTRASPTARVWDDP